MTELSFGIWGALYAVGGTVTVGYLLSGALRWLSANRPRGAEDWVFLPVLVVNGLAMAIITVWFAVFAWPVVVFVVIREKRRARAERRALEAREEEALLTEIREARRDIVPVCRNRRMKP